MRLTFPILAAAALLAGCSAAQNPATGGFLEVCSDPGTTPAEAFRICRLALEDKTITPEQRALANYNAGIAAYQLGRYREAIELEGAAVRLKPTLEKAYVTMAQAYERLGDDRAALAGYTGAIRVDPSAREAWFGRGVLLRRTGKTKEGLADLDRALQIDPGWGEALFERGLTRIALGDYRGAEADFSTVLRQTPEDKAALVNRGQARAAMGSPRAGEDFDRAIQIDEEYGTAYLARAQWLDAQGRTEAANADYLEAYRLGVDTPALVEKVRQISGG